MIRRLLPPCLSRSAALLRARALPQVPRPGSMLPPTPLGFVRFKSTLPPAAAAVATAAASPKEARLLIGFTCKVCNHRQHKTMSKQAYQKGVVLIQCDSCKNRHLIADNLGWFRDSRVDVEQLMREKGEEVRRLKSLDLLDDVEVAQAQQALDDADSRSSGGKE